MAKIEGTQTIPASSLDNYRAALFPHAKGNVVGKRYPYRLPKMQKGGKGVSDKQKAQRSRFDTIKNNFKKVGSAERQRWYDSEPPWNSFLWYYNYFIMSGLSGNANIDQGGAGVIKKIQAIKTSIGSAGGTMNIPTAVDPEKAVIMAWGGQHQAASEFGEAEWYAWAWAVYPVPKILNSSRVEIDWSETPVGTGNVSLQIIEYI